MPQMARKGHPKISQIQQIAQVNPQSKTARHPEEANPSLASPVVAFVGGRQELGGLWTEAAESKNVAKTTMHACSADERSVAKPQHGICV